MQRYCAIPNQIIFDFFQTSHNFSMQNIQFLIFLTIQDCPRSDANKKKATKCLEGNRKSNKKCKRKNWVPNRILSLWSPYYYNRVETEKKNSIIKFVPLDFCCNSVTKNKAKREKKNDSEQQNFCCLGQIRQINVWNDKIESFFSTE